MTNAIKTAQDRFAKGFNCSQAVFSAYASQIGIDDEDALKLAAPFGGGVSRQGNVCGAVTGALLALGLGRGNATLENKDENYRLADEFINRFREQHGTILCRELIGHDLSSSDGLKNARDQKVFESVCPGLVMDAAGLVADFLDE
jgi:C_GCAxxG_C_C family probable redox protein